MKVDDVSFAMNAQRPASNGREEMKGRMTNDEGRMTRGRDEEGCPRPIAIAS